MLLALPVDKSSPNFGQNHLSSGQQKYACNDEEGMI